MYLRRIGNIIRSRFSYLLSLAGIYRFRHMPEFLSVEPADWCMLSCPECPVGRRGQKSTNDRGLLGEELMRKILDECADYLHTIQFFFQGEPLLNRQLPLFIAMAKQKHIYTIVSTNALLVTPEYARALIGSGVDRLIVSIDGFSRQSYSEYRVGGSFRKALAGLRLLAEAKHQLKAKTKIEWQCLMLKSNQHEWQLIRDNYKRLGADCLTLKTAQFYEFAHGNPLMPDNERYSRYKQLADGRFVRKKPYRNHCLRLWSGAVVDVKGNLLPCCFDKTADYAFGNICNESIAGVWHSDKAETFRRRLMLNRREIDICLNCTE
ncbi:MAG: SPASM domain-containing protein [Paludibacteraceae bacterium]|nr:SPASM domain-containing protein [Paludibacteraceae bacterium]